MAREKQVKEEGAQTGATLPLYMQPVYDIFYFIDPDTLQIAYNRQKLTRYHVWIKNPRLSHHEKDMKQERVKITRFEYVIDDTLEHVRIDFYVGSDHVLSWVQSAKIPVTFLTLKIADTLLELNPFNHPVGDEAISRLVLNPLSSATNITLYRKTSDEVLS